MKLIDRLSPENREIIEGIRDIYPSTYQSLIQELTEKERLWDLTFKAVTMLASHLDLEVRFSDLYKTFDIQPITT